MIAAARHPPARRRPSDQRQLLLDFEAKVLAPPKAVAGPERLGDILARYWASRPAPSRRTFLA